MILSGNSYTEDSDIDTARQEDEKYYETMREYYKDDWLYALSAKQGDSSKSEASEVVTEEKEVKDENTDKSSGKGTLISLVISQGSPSCHAVPDN